MIDSLFRSPYQKFLIDPILPHIHRIEPLTLTGLACLFGLAVCPLLFFQLPLLALVALFLSGYLDTLDGSVARYSQKTSSLGTVCDIVSDRFVEWSIILGLYFVDPLQRALPSLFMLGSVLLCITSFLVVGIFTPNDSEKSFYYSPGLIERTEAFGFWSAMILWPAAYLPLAYLFSFLVFLTTAMRLKQFKFLILNKTSADAGSKKVVHDVCS